MRNSTRFTLSYAGLATATALGLMALTGCGSSETPKTSGIFDEVKYTGAVKPVKAKTHQDSRQQAETERYCKVKKKNGTCKTYGTRKTGRTVTVSVTVTDAPAKPGKPAIWCVELDNVEGNPEADDQLFEVSWKTYSKWENKPEGAKVTDMEYDRSLSKCKR